MQLQRKDQQPEDLTQLIRTNWQDAWQTIQVKADNTALEILKQGTPQLSLVNTGTGSMENSIMIMESIICMMLDYYGVEWQKIQIRETAELWAKEYYWMHIAEIKHFLTKCKVGDYGKIFGKLSPSTIMDWLQSYASESLNTRASMYVQEHEKHKYREENARHSRDKQEREKEKDERAARIKYMQDQVANKMKDNQ